MLNLKETLKNLHKKFPNLTIDELFDIVDCYSEEIKIYSQSPIIPNPYKYYTTEPFSLKDWTVTCDYPKDSAANQISNKLNGGITYANNSNHTSRSSTR
jgi:hypothetical protein